MMFLDLVAERRRISIQNAIEASKNQTAIKNQPQYILDFGSFIHLSSRRVASLSASFAYSISDGDQSYVLKTEKRCEEQIVVQFYVIVEITENT
jgi:hypothetical protein